MKKVITLIIFLLVNFGSLWIGSYLMNEGPRTSWYLDLEKAPWNPPSWLFGVAWTTIMVCFSIYLTILFDKIKTQNKFLVLYGIQIVLNISWNYIFFNQHLIGLGLVILLLLLIIILVFYKQYKVHLKKISYLLLPYILWLFVAISLNAYIFIKN